MLTIVLVFKCLPFFVLMCNNGPFEKTSFATQSKYYSQILIKVQLYLGSHKQVTGA